MRTTKHPTLAYPRKRAHPGNIAIEKRPTHSTVNLAPPHRGHRHHQPFLLLFCFCSCKDSNHKHRLSSSRHRAESRCSKVNTTASLVHKITCVTVAAYFLPRVDEAYALAYVYLVLGTRTALLSFTIATRIVIVPFPQKRF